MPASSFDDHFAERATIGVRSGRHGATDAMTGLGAARTTSSPMGTAILERLGTGSDVTNGPLRIDEVPVPAIALVCSTVLAPNRKIDVLPGGKRRLAGSWPTRDNHLLAQHFYDVDHPENEFVHRRARREDTQ